MKPQQRFARIDIIRGVAMVAMIVIHAVAYFLNDASVFFIWNSLQFAVVTFIFCSAYLFFKKPPVVKLSSARFLAKRALRLLIPYWIYIFALLILLRLKGEELSAISVLRFITLTTNSNDLSWLVVLMVTLTPVMLFSKSVKKTGFLYILFTLISFFSSLVFLFYVPPINFKFIMWLPWSLIIVASDYFVSNENTRFFFAKFLTLTLTVFLLTLMIKIITNSSLVQYDNKYPPNLFHLLYGFFMTVLFYRFAKKISNYEMVKKPLTFFSRYSYSIYFIHFLVIWAFINFTNIQKYGVVIFLPTILIVTLIVQWVFTHLNNTFQSALKSAT